MQQLISQYQALVVGGIGFAGVIVTLLYNGYLARSLARRDRQERRNSVRVALCEELRLQSDGLRQNLDDQAYQQEGGLLIPMTPLDRLYECYREDVLLLSPAQIKATLEAYGTLDSYRRWVGILGTDISQHQELLVFRVPMTNWPVLKQVLEELVGALDRCVAILSADDA